MTPSARVVRELLAETELHREASPQLRQAFIDLRHKLAKAEAATAKRDGIEADMITQIGYPRVLIPDGTPTAPRYAATLAHLDLLLADHPRDAGIRRELRLELRTRQQQWRGQAQATGLTAALRAEHHALTALDVATATFLAQPVTTVIDIALVLAVVVACGEARPSEAETFPWRELRKLFTTSTEL